MATTSEIKKSLIDIATAINTERQALKNAKSRIATGNNNLGNLPTIYADVISSINAFDAESGTEFEKLCKDELDKLATEFTALQSAAGGAVTSLSSITEF